MFLFKVCCIQSIEEATMAIDYGASILGLVGEMPSGPGVIPLDIIQSIAHASRGKAATWLLSSNTTYQALIEECAQVETSGIQLVDEVEEEVCQAIKKELPHVQLIQVRHVTNEISIKKQAAVNPHIDAILLDSGSPKSVVKILGGTGRTHDWEISKEIVQLANVPVFLAGGLNPNNVLQAIQTVRPYGVDVCKGLRTKNRLDLQKIKAWSDVLQHHVD